MFSLTFKAFVKIIEDHGFTVDRQNGTSHKIYKGKVGGKTRLVTVACHNRNDHIVPNTLASMIRQSGIPRKTFKNYRNSK